MRLVAASAPEPATYQSDSGTESRCARVQNGFRAGQEMSPSRAFGVLSSLPFGQTTEQTAEVETQQARAVPGAIADY
jgi:hypothetical protein